MRWSAGLTALGFGLALVAMMPPAEAQMPYPPPPPVAPAPEAADIAYCLCLQQAVNALGGGISGGQGEYRAAQDELARLDAELQGARGGLDVNNPQAVAQFRQLLERRDAASSRATRLAAGQLSGVTERYNARVNEYNARCANRPRDPRLVDSVRATLSCPPTP